MLDNDRVKYAKIDSIKGNILVQEICKTNKNEESRTGGEAGGNDEQKKAAIVPVFLL